MEDDREIAPDLLQDRQGPAADVDEVLADRLDPADLGPLAQETRVMLGAKPDAVPELSALECHCLS